MRRKEKKLEDFGEKIGGAAKDKIRRNLLSAEEIAFLDEQELIKKFEKKVLWPKPNFDQLLNEGADIIEVFRMKYVYTLIPRYLTVDKEAFQYFTHEMRAQYIHEYAGYVNDLKDKLQKSVNDDMVTESNSDSNTKFTEMDKKKIFGFMPEKKARSIMKYLTASREQLGQEIIKKGFGFDLEMKAMQKMAISKYSDSSNKLIDIYWGPEGKNLRSTSWLLARAQKYREGYEDQTYVLLDTKSRKVLVKNLPSKEAAIAIAVDQYLKENSTADKQTGIPEKAKKTAWKPPVLTSVERTGADYRKGKKATENDFLEKLDLRAGEFGNSLPNIERQFHMDMCFDSLMDLSRILKIEPTDIGLGGRLAIAFASRGRGRAAAHYEPYRRVINLTRKHGPGSLGHEWAHALDDLIGESCGIVSPDGSNSFMSSNQDHANLPDSFRRVMDAIIYDPDTGHITKYFENSRRFDGAERLDKVYYSSRCEMFARSFQCYLQDKMTDGKNDYLNFTANKYERTVCDDDGNVVTLRAFPEGKDRVRINEAIEDMIIDFKDRGLLHELIDRPKEDKTSIKSTDFMAHSTEYRANSVFEFTYTEDENGFARLFDPEVEYD